VPPTTPEGAYVIQEGSVLNVLAPNNKKVSSVSGYYGDPNNGSRGQDVSSILSTLLVGQTSAIIEVSNSTFENDPAPGTTKVLIVLISYEDITVDPSPTASPEPQPSESQTPTLEPSPQPSEPGPQPTETSEPPLEPSPTPTPSLSPSEPPLPPVVPVVTPSPTPEQPISSPSPEAPVPTESPVPSPSPSSTDNPSNNNIIDGLTAEESLALNELLTEYGPTDAISFESFQESGLDYENLPPDQPVMLENGVILTAEVADALEIFEDPSELLLTALTDPGKALKAFASIGADMTPEKRKESQIVVVASIIIGQIISTTNLITGRIR
jgi:hypothetical protein